MRNRLKSWVFWSSLAAQILAVLTATEIIDLQMGNVIQAVVTALLECFVTFGILNNPTDANNF